MKITPVGMVLLGAISYLSYHAIAGEQGLSQWTRMQESVRKLASERDSLSAEKATLQGQIARLYLESLDDDLLEELARQKFHFVYPGELILEPPEMTAQHPENEDLFALSIQ
jgi:cell division protein FtsB